MGRRDSRVGEKKRGQMRYIGGKVCGESAIILAIPSGLSTALLRENVCTPVSFFSSVIQDASHTL